MVAPQLAIVKVEGSTPRWGFTSFGNDEQHNNACVVFLVPHRESRLQKVLSDKESCT